MFLKKNISGFRNLKSILSVCFSVALTFNVYSAKLKEGTYRATLLLDEKYNVFLPFNFDVVYKNKLLLMK